MRVRSAHFAVAVGLFLLPGIGGPRLNSDAAPAASYKEVYIAIRRSDYDSQHTGVVKLDREWRIVGAVGFGQPGDPVFNAVHDLALGKDGSIYVAETRTKRVVKLRPVR